MPGTCPRCQKTVYFNEEKIAMGKSFHKSCFSCANKTCNRKLDSGNLTTHDNELYCKVCYGRLFGPKGYGYGVGAGVLSMDTGSNGDEPTRDNVSTLAQAFMAPVLETTKSEIETADKPKATEGPADDGSANNGSASDGSANGGSTNGVNGSSTSSNSSSPVPPPAKLSSTIGKKASISFDSFGNRVDICPRCSKQVYLAEKMVAGGKAWHKMSCFNCAECHKRLESTTLCEKEGEIYCKTCYAKKWGPSGYGHGINAGVRKVD